MLNAKELGIEAIYASLAGRNLQSVDFSDCALPTRSFRKSDIRGARFDKGRLALGQFTEVNGEASSWIGADLRNGDFSGARLPQCDFTSADLQRTEWDGAELAGSTFRNADLRGADLSGASIAGCDFSGAQCDDHTKWPIDAGATALSVVAVLREKFGA